MARGESQGLQIAVILLTMCVVGLAISTWVYFQSYDTAVKAKESADAAAKSANDQKNAEIYKLKVFQHIAGDPAVSQEDIDRAKQLAGTPDANAETFLKKYKDAIQLHDKAFAGDAKARSIIDLPQYLVAGIATRNEQFKDSTLRETKLDADVKATEEREQGRTKAAEADMQKATASLAEEQKKFGEERNKYKAELEKLKEEREKLQADLDAEKKKAAKDLEVLAATNSRLEKDVEDLSQKVIRLSKDGPSFEAPDGQITWVSQRQRLVWIDVGSADGLTRQTTFSVFDHDENGVSAAKRKARIEVIRVDEPHLAECRILEDEIKNPILPGDKIFTPAWSPGQRIHFALAGMIDIDEDGEADNEEIRSIIEVNGGKVDGEVRPDGTVIGAINNQTRYLIRGKAPSEKSFTADEGRKAFNNYSDIQENAEKFGVEIIDSTRFFGLMGWKAQQRTTTLGKSRTGPKVQKSGDAGPKSKPEDTEKPAAEDAEKDDKPEDKAAPEDDPFK